MNMPKPITGVVKSSWGNSKMLPVRIEWLNTGGIVIKAEGYTETLDELVATFPIGELDDDINFNPYRAKTESEDNNNGSER